MNFSNSLKSVLLAVCLSALISPIVASPQMVIYWGQNSIGSWTNDPAKQEPDLRTYCQDSSYDIIVVGFVYLFPVVSGSAYPGMNFANHCEQPFDNSDPYVLDCTKNISPDIEYCQSRGKKIFLSFGGGVGLYGFSSDAEATTFATLVWNMFLGGNKAGVPRPFGTSIFDGIDLDIEGGTDVGYTAFINTLRGYFAKAPRTYEISAAPQCFYPDRIGPGPGTPLSTAWFDYVWIQFYNNHCGVQNYGNSMYNFNVWVNWATTNSVNKNVKLFIGAPASPKAAASGYVSVETLKQIAADTNAQYPNVYGGLMLWDACTSDDNDYFGTKVAAFVHSQSSASSGAAATSTTGPKPVTTKAKPATTGAVKPATTGAAKPVTTGAAKPVTTGASKPANTGATKPVTTGRMKKITTGKPAQATSTSTSTSTSGPATSTTGPAPVDLSTTTSSTSTSTSTSTSGADTGSVFRCNYGEMRCTSTNTYQSCGYAKDGLHDWSESQACQNGLVCTASAPYIYCTRPARHVHDSSALE